MQISTKVMYQVVPPLAPMPVVGAQVFVIDKDKGGNGDDVLSLGSTDQNGLADGDVQWQDKNTVSTNTPFARIEAEVPDLPELSLEIRYDGRTERYPLPYPPPPQLPVFVSSAPPVDCILPAAPRSVTT